MRNLSVTVVALLLASCAASKAFAATYQVGPTRPLKTLWAVAPTLKPGDVVQIDGDATYAGNPAVTGDTWIKVSGTAAAPITIQGVKVNGKRPVLAGGVNTLQIQGDHFVVQGLEITGGTSRCVFVHGSDIAMRDMVIHGCNHHGVLGSDNDSGTFLFEYSEVYDCGFGDEYHALYLSTDEEVHPGSVARVQHNWIHDNRGIGLKSRAERTEVYSNWFENQFYYDVQPTGSQEAEEGKAREDADIVGNVMVRHNDQAAMLLGGDGTAQSFGRYRVAFNTIITAQAQWQSPAIRLRDGIESIQMDNNVFFSTTSAPLDLFRYDVIWTGAGRQMSGSGNWLPTGATNVPPEWKGTITGADPGFTNRAGFDFTPTANSPLVDRATLSAVGPPGYAIPAPLARPLAIPARRLQAVGSATGRGAGALDIGALESGPSSSGAVTSTTTTSATTTTAASTGATAGATTGAGGGSGTIDPGTNYVWPLMGVGTLGAFLAWLGARVLLKKKP